MSHIHTMEADSRSVIHVDVTALDAVEVRNRTVILHLCGKQPVSLDYESITAAKTAASELTKVWKN